MADGGSDCAFAQRCKEVLHSELALRPHYFDPAHDLCMCESCCAARGDKERCVALLVQCSLARGAVNTPHTPNSLHHVSDTPAETHRVSTSQPVVGFERP